MSLSPQDRNILCVFPFVKYHSKNVISEKAACKLTKLKGWLFDSSWACWAALCLILTIPALSQYQRETSYTIAKHSNSATWLVV